MCRSEALLAAAEDSSTTLLGPPLYFASLTLSVTPSPPLALLVPMPPCLKREVTCSPKVSPLSCIRTVEDAPATFLAYTFLRVPVPASSESPSFSLRSVFSYVCRTIVPGRSSSPLRCLASALLSRLDSLWWLLMTLMAAGVFPTALLALAPCLSSECKRNSAPLILGGDGVSIYRFCFCSSYYCLRYCYMRLFFI